MLDLNDNAPIFDPMSYSNEIYENIAIGKDVVTVSATDIDSGTPIFFSVLLPLVYALFRRGIRGSMIQNIKLQAQQPKRENVEWNLPIC